MNYLNKKYKDWTTAQITAEIKKWGSIIPTTGNKYDPYNKVAELKRELNFRKLLGC